MWNETVTLYLDDTSIRLVVSQGQKVKKWADVHLEPGLIKDSMVIQEVEVAARIKKLLKSQKVKTHRVILGISGLHSLTRPATLPQLPKSMLPEAVAREARRVLPVPLDQLYLSWCPIPCPKGRIQVFMAATQRKMTDSMMKTLHSAGLNPYRMTIKPLALTKPIPVNKAILVDLQPTEFDILIMVDGIPQPIRTIALPDEELKWEKKLDMIINDLERTIKFYDTNNPEKPLDKSVPIFVSGELKRQPESFKSLSDACGHPVSILSPEFKGSEQMVMARYLINIAMVTRAPNIVRQATFPIANLNLLPAPYQPKPISLTKVVGIPCGVAVAGLIVPLVMTMQSNSASTATMQNQLDITNQMINQKIAQKQGLQKSITDLQQQVAASKATYDSFKLSLDTLKKHQEYINGDISVTLAKLQPTISLTQISDSASNLIITGTAPTDNDVYQFAQAILKYARGLDLSDRYSQSTVSHFEVDTEVYEAEGQIYPDGIKFILTFDR